MSKKKNNEEVKEEVKEEKVKKEDLANEKLEADLEALRKENEELKTSVAKEKDDYLRLMADFENFRRHSAETKLELVSTASADIIKGLLPVLDDFERAMKMLTELKCRFPKRIRRALCSTWYRPVILFPAR